MVVTTVPPLVTRLVARRVLKMGALMTVWWPIVVAVIHALHP